LHLYIEFEKEEELEKELKYNNKSFDNKTIRIEKYNK
jgi:hypothetical protein